MYLVDGQLLLQILLTSPVEARVGGQPLGQQADLLGQAALLEQGLLQGLCPGEDEGLRVPPRGRIQTSLEVNQLIGVIAVLPSEGLVGRIPFGQGALSQVVLGAEGLAPGIGLVGEPEGIHFGLGRLLPGQVGLPLCLCVGKLGL